MIVDEAQQKGTGKWTVQDAMDLRVPVPAIGSAVHMRDLSDLRKERQEAATSALRTGRAPEPGRGAVRRPDGGP